MTDPLFQRTRLQEAFAALRNDLIHEDGPRISTMRNYRFAIVQYERAAEFQLRGEVQRLNADLTANGWMVLSISLQKLLFERSRQQGQGFIDGVVQMEERMGSADPERGLDYLKAKLSPLIEGPDGIAADCSRIISDYAKSHPDSIDRTLALIGRAGSIFPVFSASGLLRHIDGRTANVPEFMLYPGERHCPLIHGDSQSR